MIEPALTFDADTTVGEVLAELDRYRRFKHVAIRRNLVDSERAWFAFTVHKLRWLLQECNIDEPLETALALAHAAGSTVFDQATVSTENDSNGVVVFGDQLLGIAVQNQSLAERSGDSHRHGTVVSSGGLLDTENVRGQPPINGQDGVAKEQPWIVIPVLFATDRNLSGRADLSKFFGGRRGELQFGLTEVSIPALAHKRGEIETPLWWKFEFRPDPRKHVVLRSIALQTRDEFVSSGRNAIAGAKRDELLIFIHGYNVSFENAARRTAQIAYDLRFAGIPLLYSWPSIGNTFRYTEDETNARWTLTHFSEFLALAMSEFGASAVHVIAHSMGNRVITECLRTFLPPPNAAHLRQLVLAAPDIDAQTFDDLARKFYSRAERVTLYASSRDLALKGSKLVHGYPRAGDTMPELRVVAGVDTIDASAVDTNLLGHSYISDERSILADVFNLLDKGEAPADRRFHLQPAMQLGQRYWIFSP